MEWIPMVRHEDPDSAAFSESTPDPDDRVSGVSVQVAEVDGRVRIVGVLVRDPDGVTLDQLRSIPVPRMEAAWNAPILLAGSGAIASSGTGVLTVASFPPPAIPKPPTKRQLRLTIPGGGRYPDGFYERVARLYRALVANGIRPAPAIAEANGVPVTTVHRWVKEARRRGVLAPARKGGAT